MCSLNDKKVNIEISKNTEMSRLNLQISRNGIQRRAVWPMVFRKGAWIFAEKMKTTAIMETTMMSPSGLRSQPTLHVKSTSIQLINAGRKKVLCILFSHQNMIYLVTRCKSGVNTLFLLLIEQMMAPLMDQATDTVMGQAIDLEKDLGQVRALYTMMLKKIISVPDI